MCVQDITPFCVLLCEQKRWRGKFDWNERDKSKMSTIWEKLQHTAPFIPLQLSSFFFSTNIFFPAKVFSTVNPTSYLSFFHNQNLRCGNPRTNDKPNFGQLSGDKKWNIYILWLKISHASYGRESNKGDKYFSTHHFHNPAKRWKVKKELFWGQNSKQWRKTFSYKVIKNVKRVIKKKYQKCKSDLSLILALLLLPQLCLTFLNWGQILRIGKIVQNWQK